MTAYFKPIARGFFSPMAGNLRFDLKVLSASMYKYIGALPLYVINARD